MKVLSIFDFDVKKSMVQSSEDVSSVIPGQDVSIREMLERASRGQRLSVPTRPLDMVPDDGSDKYDDPLEFTEQYNDEVDVMLAVQQQQAHSDDVAKPKEEEKPAEDVPADTH